MTTATPVSRILAASCSVLFVLLTGCGDAAMAVAARGDDRSPLSQPELAEVLQTPLIIGASVSADFHTPSPGKRLSLEYTTSDHITNTAFMGSRGVKQVGRLGDALLADRSIVFGIDLFFWDSLRSSTDETVHAIHKIVVAARPLPGGLVLGTIPALLPGQRSRDFLNGVIRSVCTEAVNCHLYDIDRRNEEITAAGGIDFEGRHYTRRALTLDGLHLSTLGSKIIAAELEQLLMHSAAIAPAVD